MTEGYNIRIKVNDKYLIGVTSDEVSISPNTKESVVKENAGVKQESVVGHTTTFSISGLIDMTGGGTTMLDNDDILELAALTGADAEVDIDYVRGSGTAYTGTGIITGYTETNPADPEEDPTYGLTIESEDMEASS
ncbi:MAG: hypothetical protein K5910_01945 [Bacteroidales bacterium]|nr:hypothetical protein [Bacteroidales bacterium]